MAAVHERAAKEIGPCSTAVPFFPGSAQGVDENMIGPFLDQDMIYHLLLPHHPLWGSTQKAYRASGQAASALHTMAILQFYQNKVFTDLHEGVPGPELLQERHSATDYALRATKVIVQALGKAMSTMVVQECHLWLNLAEIQSSGRISNDKFIGQSILWPLELLISSHCVFAMTSHSVPTPYMSGVLPLTLLVESLTDWLNLLNPSFQGENDVVFRVEIATLVVRGVIEPTQAVPAVCLRRTGFSVQGPLSLCPCRLAFLRRLQRLPLPLSVNVELVTMTTRLSQDCAISAEVRESTQTQNSGPPEILQEAPGAHGILSHGHTAGSDVYETAAALASYPSPEMDMTPRGSPRTSVQMHYCNNSFQDRLGHRMQWACSLRGLDRPSAALTYKLPGVADSAFNLEEVLTFGSGQARVGLSRQLSNCSIHQPPGQCPPLLLHVETSSPSPTLEPAQTQVSMCYSHSGQTQSCGEPHCTDTVQSQGEQGTASAGGPVLAHQDLVFGACAHVIKSSLVHSSEEGPPLSGEGHNLAPVPRSLEPPSLVPGDDQEDFRDLPPAMVNTLEKARTPYTKQLYDLKWRIFVNWCSSQGKDPWRCGIESVLSFLQGGLDRHLSTSTLNVHAPSFVDAPLLEGSLRVHRGVGPAYTEAERQLHSWGLQLDLLKGMETGDPLSPSSPTRSTAHSVGSEARCAVTSSYYLSPVRWDLLSQAGGSILNPCPELLKLAQLIAFGLSAEVVETILKSRAPSTRKLYASKWRLFTSWCRDHQLDRVNCPIGTVLEFFLREGPFSTGLTYSTFSPFLRAEQVNGCHAGLFVPGCLGHGQLCKFCTPNFIGLFSMLSEVFGLPIVTPSVVHSTQRLHSLHQGSRVTIHN
ncbi:hypothetical protein H4Q32_017837 [Labeo rohita]|uniref:Uncharacterized protein n=1 Tax=Labeo rohita TaxID=84645 RepID=A0ABQ8LZP8_LABRO|nr:hypothetical protein H4Q32_017837 [Labeo rohita]